MSSGMLFVSDVSLNGDVMFQPPLLQGEVETC